MRILIFIFSLCLALQAKAFSPEDLRSFGQSAPVQMYLFTSLSCLHCADFHKKILPTIKKEYADTGKAQIIIVDMIQGGAGLLASQVVRCLDSAKADKLESELYAHQSRWAKHNMSVTDIKRALAAYAERQGMTKEQFNLCVNNKELQKAIIEQQANLARLYDIKGTPTLVMRKGNEVRKWSGVDKQIFNELKEAFRE